jgi:hypothetical protein
MDLSQFFLEGLVPYTSHNKRFIPLNWAHDFLEAGVMKIHAFFMRNFKKHQDMNDMRI